VQSATSPILSAPETGEHKDALFSTLYSELHRLAKRQAAKQWSPNPIGATTLLHEAYLDMADRNDVSFQGQAHFLGYAARVMRGLIIDRIRNRNASKRGGEFHITSLTLSAVENPPDARDLASISDALEELAQIEPNLATLVDLKFFCGFSFAEIAAMQGLSERTVQRKWEKARIYLHRSIRTDLPV
jgi:RNA polymerase sigma factor (TIGR02999 family)